MNVFEGALVEFRFIVAFGIAAVFLAVCACQPLPAAERTVLLIAGPPSHGRGEHEFNAGVALLQKSLASVPGLTTRTAVNGWPATPSLFDGVDAVVIYSDGGATHPAIIDDHLSTLERLVARGVGLGLIHYAVESSEDGGGREEFLRWIGGCFDLNWSVNPVWTADIEVNADHPVTRGVKAFRIKDEWYYHMRFPSGMVGVTPLLTATPTAKTLTRPDGPHEGNPAVRAAVARGDSQILAWAFERHDRNQGRGFGFTGGHYHRNWQNDNFRKVVLNAIVWLAKADVPVGGVTSTASARDLDANLDAKTGTDRLP